MISVYTRFNGKGKAQAGNRRDKMSTTYHFNNEIFYSYADLCNAYRKAKGYFPLKAYKQDGCSLYYK
jgi:hypothetical protein